MSNQPPVVAQRVVRDRNGRFTCAMPLRNPTGELVLPREYWDRPRLELLPQRPRLAEWAWYRRIFAVFV